MKRTGDTRKRIVEAASRLFYRSGVRAVSVDAVAEKAGITKKSFYYHFRSKDDLVEAWLAARDQPNLDAFARWYHSGRSKRAETGDPVASIEAVFEGLAAHAQKTRWRGCGFLRTAAELVETPGHPAVRRGAEHKKRLEAWFSKQFTADGLADAPALARHIVLLIDGAFASMLLHRDADYIRSAGQAARALMERR